MVESILIILIASFFVYIGFKYGRTPKPKEEPVDADIKISFFELSMLKYCAKHILVTKFAHSDPLWRKLSQAVRCCWAYYKPLEQTQNNR